MKKVLKVIGIILAVIVVAIAAILIFYRVNEFRPKDVEDVEIQDAKDGELKLGDEVDLLTFNTGYGALSADQDCYFDGGQTVIPESKDIIEKNTAGMAGILKEQDADIYFLQEVDRDAKRSYYIDEMPIYSKAVDMASMFACNFKVIYVPLNKHMGKVDAGLVTMTDYKVNSATRYQLPIAFKWPISMVNLKRCLLETRIPIEGSDKELVLINLHLEAYDSGEGKIAQTKMLMSMLEKEYKAGNYVIAGGDFNQTFEPVADAYPLTQESIDGNKWAPGSIAEKDLADGFSFAVSSNAPTCRLDDHALDDTTQLYIIDGFIVSDNVKVNAITNLDEGFAYTDHNPVKLNFTLE